MKILVLSDSHGNLSNMERAVELTQPRAILHLGDCWRDGEKLHGLYPDLLFEQVPGNCDVRPGEPLEKMVLLADKCILLCHGHTYGVKNSLLSARYAAEEQGADLFLFGHTHRPYQMLQGNTLLLNPGSIGNSIHPSYALIQIQQGKVDARLLRLE